MSAPPITFHGRFRSHHGGLVPGAPVPAVDHDAIGLGRAGGQDVLGPLKGLKGLWHGATVFMVCGGPSLRTTRLDLLDRRGIVIMALNNAWTMVRPHLWVAVDSPERFVHWGWQDPGVLKFVPVASRDMPTRVRRGRDLWEDGPPPARLPGVVYFARREGFEPCTFWDSQDGSFQWGWGDCGGRSVFLVALGLCAWLGFGRIVLVGADFRMPVSETEPAYGWGEDKDGPGRAANNRLYQDLNDRVSMLVREPGAPEILNATPGSSLVIPPDRVSLEDVVNACTVPEDDPVGWYTRRRHRT